MEPTGGVGQNHVRPPGPGRFQGVVGHRGRVGPRLAGHQVGPEPFRPDRELFGRRGPEGVGAGQEHRPAIALERARQLGDGGGLPDPVDPHHQDRERPDTRGRAQRPLRPPKPLEEARSQGLPDRGRIGPLAAGQSRAHIVYELKDGRGPEVGRKKDLLQGLPGLLISRRPGEQALDLRDQRLAGLAHPGPEAGSPS